MDDESTMLNNNKIIKDSSKYGEINSTYLDNNKNDYVIKEKT